MKNEKILFRSIFSTFLVSLIVLNSVGARSEVFKVEEGKKNKEDIVLTGKQIGINISGGFQELEKLIIAGESDKVILKAEEIANNYQQIIKNLTKTRNYLESKNIDSNILDRLDKYKEEYEKSIGNLVGNFSKADELKDYQEQLGLIKALNQKNQKKEYEKTENPRPFKVSQEGKVIKKRISAQELKSLKTIDSKIPTIKLKETNLDVRGSLIEPDYLLEGGEIEFSQSIKDLAESLNKDPLNILNYVKNNIDYVPYYGLKKGADATLIERAGNDFDQSALLIALLRYSGYPAKYKHGQVNLNLNQVMNLLGVEDPIVAAKLLYMVHIPYILYVNESDEPLFFVIEHTWVEAYITYNYTRGINQTAQESDKMWIPMEPSLKAVYYSQVLDITEEMNFNVNSFYENYLNGNYNQLKPIEAYRREITNYLSVNHPDLTYEDILLQTYKQKEDLEFIPDTLPYEVIGIFDEYSQIPNNLKHKIQLEIIDRESSIELLNQKILVDQLADKQLVISYMAASQADQDVVDLYDSIYDIVPLSLVNVKPVIKVQEEIRYGGGSSEPEITLGKKQELIIRFLVPKRENEGLIEYQEELFEKETIAGNTEAIAINTDRIVLPELRPSQDTQTTEFISTQKLLRTASDYLDKLQKSNQELANTIGRGYTNSAVGAIVFNGIDVNYQLGEPYSFEWKGLRIESWAKVNYFNHFGKEDPLNKRKTFVYLLGLEGSFNESSIFEEDFSIESMSTVKGLRLINQGKIPGVSIIKIDSNNRNIIETLNLSEETKSRFRASVDVGNIIYTASRQFTYQNWTGLIYIDLDPGIGSAGYIIGEGLNGGYTIEQWSNGWSNFWRKNLPNLIANIITPSNNQTFIQGEKIRWFAHYESTFSGELFYGWNEELSLDTSNLSIGNNTFRTGYGINKSVEVRIIEREPDSAGDDPIKISEEFNPKFIIKNSAFNNSSSMTEAEIQAFLDEKGGDNPNHISKRKFAGHKAAYWIKKGADMAGINPKILLVKMQTEQGLIVGTRSINPVQSWIDWAINAGFTEDIVYAKYRGFITQMISGSEEFLRKWYNKSSELNYILEIDVNETPGINNWQSLKTLNASTFSLYKFTPHVYEGGRLVYTIYSNFFGTNDLGGPIE